MSNKINALGFEHNNTIKLNYLSMVYINRSFRKISFFNTILLDLVSKSA